MHGNKETSSPQVKKVDPIISRVRFPELIIPHLVSITSFFFDHHPQEVMLGLKAVTRFLAVWSLHFLLPRLRVIISKWKFLNGVCWMLRNFSESATGFWARKKVSSSALELCPSCPLLNLDCVQRLRPWGGRPGGFPGSLISLPFVKQPPFCSTTWNHSMLFIRRYVFPSSKALKALSVEISVHERSRS